MRRRGRLPRRQPSTVVGVRSGNNENSDRGGWPVDDLTAVVAPVFDWRDGDGTTQNGSWGGTLTAAGTINARSATPWTRPDGSTLTCSSFAQGANYTSATTLDPTEGHDMVIVALLRLGALAANSAIIATRNTGVGWMLYGNVTPQIAFRAEDSVGNVTSAAAITGSTWLVVGLTYDADGNQVLYADGVAVDTDDVSGLGDLASGLGVGVNSRPDGALDEASCISRVMVWYGANLAATATATWHANVAAWVRGEV